MVPARNARPVEMAGDLELAVRFAGRTGSQRFERLRASHAAQFRPPEPPKSQPDRNVGTTWLLAIPLVLIVISGLALAAAHLAGGSIANAGHSSDMSLRQIVVGNDVLEVPANKIRFGSQRRAHTAARLDLYMHWPSMNGFSDNLRPIFNSTEIEPSILFLTIEPRSMSLDMSGRIEPIYRQFFAGEPQSAGSGLMRVALSPEAGFADEELVFQASSPWPWAARCSIGEGERASAFCIRDIHAGRDLAVTYRFHRSLLPQWLEIEEAVQAQIRAMVAG
jgi:hypothetical protein